MGKPHEHEHRRGTGGIKGCSSTLTDGDVRRARQPADEQPADRRRAPSADLLARLGAELRQRDGFDNSALLTKLSERCRLASRRHLVRQRKEATLGVTDNRNLLPVPETRVYGTRLRVRRVDPGDPDLPVTAQSGPALNSVWGGAGPRQAARQQTARQHYARAPRLCCGTHTLFPHLCIFPGSVGSYNVGRQRTCRAPPP